MFDRILTVQEAPRGPSHVTVHEHRAPTDASIKLYAELLEKARAEIVGHVAHPHDNVLSHATIEVNTLNLSDEHEHYVVFRLNGTVHKLRFSIARDAREQMIRSIAATLLEHVGRELERSLPRK
jgi:hypothetical protein